MAENTWKSFSIWRTVSLQYSTAGFGHVKTFLWRGSSPQQQRFAVLQQHVKHRVCEQHFAPAHTSERTGDSLGDRGAKALGKVTLKMKVIARTKAQRHSSYSSLHVPELQGGRKQLAQE